MENNISFKQLFTYYLKKWYFLAGAVILGLIGGNIYSSVQRPMYSSTAQVVVLSRPTTGGSSDVIMGNYKQIITSRRIAEVVSDKIGGDNGIDIAYISGALSASNTKNSEILDIEAQTSDPERSRIIVDATVEAFAGILDELYQIESENVQVIGAPMAASRPFNINRPMSVGAGAGIGLVLSAAIIFMVFDMQVAKGKTQAGKARKTKLEKLAEQAKIQEYEASIAESQSRINTVDIARIESEAKKTRVEAMREESRTRLVAAQTKTANAEIDQNKAMQTKLESIKNLEESKVRNRFDIAAAKREAKIIAKARTQIAKNRAAKQIAASREEVVAPAAPVAVPVDLADYGSLKIKTPGWNRE